MSRGKVEQHPLDADVTHPRLIAFKQEDPGIEEDTEQCGRFQCFLIRVVRVNNLLVRNVPSSGEPKTAPRGSFLREQKRNGDRDNEAKDCRNKENRKLWMRTPKKQNLSRKHRLCFGSSLELLKPE
uniref:Uncharacterized protein n=1 Tax=Steinernema glaseri TaxID=37863 RepID=A0A1I7ZFV2_9BILA